MLFAATGHRPHGIGHPYSHDRLTEFAKCHLHSLPTTAVVSGMAQGWDLAVAEAAVALELPLIAAVPFPGQEDRWHDLEDRARYHRLLVAATEVFVMSQKPHSVAYRDRDYWMVDRAAAVLALFSGAKSGTSMTVEYAESRDRPILNLWPAWLRYCDVRGT